MRRVFTCALVLSLLTAPSAFAVDRAHLAPALSGGQVEVQGFDKCVAPPSSAMRSWLASPYRAVNIYFAGNNRACASQPDLSPQWLTTVTSNGWSVIPTYVGSQPRCTSSGVTYKIAPSTAAQQGTQEADDAATQMQALGLDPGLGNPVYFDVEPYSRTNTTCDDAAMTFLDAWSRELIVKGYVPGVYGNTGKSNGVIYSLVQHQGNPKFQEPEAIWYAVWNNDPVTTDQDQLLGNYWTGHRIHQYAGGHNQTFNGQTFNIDSDAVDGDVVTAVTPAPPSGPPYQYAAAPAAGSTLKERSTPETTPDNRTGVTYTTGSALSIQCQTTGENIDGSVVWDQLTDGAYVSDIFTTTTGGLSFTSGIPNCDPTAPDTTPPTATMRPLPPATLHSSKGIFWSGTDAESGVKSYDVRYRVSSWNGDLGGYHRLLTATTSRSKYVTLYPGQRKCFDVRATDAAGNVGAWSSDACVARALDDRALTGGSAWRRLTGHRYYLHTATATHAGGVTLHLHGAHVSLVGIVGSTGPGSGSVNVYVRRRLIGKVSLRSAKHAQRQMFLLPAFGARVGNIRVTTRTENALVRIDGIVVSG